MRGLVADVNVQGHLLYLRQLLAALELWEVLVHLKLEFATLHDLRLALDVDDRVLWNYCQREGWILFTENRNHDGADSLHATLQDSWRSGLLPVLTLANKMKFEHSRAYAERVAIDIADLMFGIANEDYLEQPRIYVPR